MQLVEQIAKIESDLVNRGLPLAALFKEAQINRSTWSRWRAGKTGPTLARWQAVSEAVEKVFTPRPVS